MPVDSGRHEQKMSFVVGVDIGGHNIRGVLAAANGESVIRLDSRIDREAKSAEANVDRVVSLIGSLIKAAGLQPDEVRALGAGVPGHTDTKRGWVMAAPNIPHWNDLPLAELLESKWGIPTFLDNDVNMAALGESWKGMARNVSDFFFLALGTGIGGGVFIEGKLYRGYRFGAGEVGYWALERNQKERRMGDLGWLESVASGLAIQERGRALASKRLESALIGMADSPDRITAHQIFEAASAGDPLAQEIVEEVTDYLALTVVNLTGLLDPELIIFGGGVSEQGERLLDPVRRKAQGFGIEIPPIRKSALGEEAQLHGAVLAALQFQRR